MRRITIFGATGLIGGLLRNELKDEHVILAVRKPLTHLFRYEQIEQVDFSNPKAYPSVFESDAICCCLGTTIKNVGGNQDKFKEIDAGYPIQIAQLAAKHGVGCLSVISSMGANKNSSVFYNRVKGEMEAGVLASNIPATTILRPSLLLGQRKEKRFGEKLAQIVMPVFNPLMFGKLRHYRAIKAEHVASVMASTVISPVTGQRILLSGDIEQQYQQL